MTTRTGPLATTRLTRMPSPGQLAVAGLAVALGVALVRIPLDLVAWLVIGAVLVAAALAAPLAVVCLIPWAAAFGSLLTVTVRGLHVTPTDALVAALATVFLFRQVQAGRLSFRGLRHLTAADVRARFANSWHRHAPQVALFAALLLYLAVIVLSLKVATDRGSALKEVVKWTEVVVVLGLSLWSIRATGQVRIIAWSAIGAGVAEALLGYAQWVTSSGLAGVDASLRVFGTFGQPNPYAGYLNLALPLALALALFSTDVRERWLAGAAAVILFGSEWLSASRGGLIGLAVALVVLLVIGSKREREAGIALAVGVPLIVLGLMTHLIPSRLSNAALRALRLNDVAANGPVSAANYSTMERLAHWIAGLNMFRAHPVLGVGAGNYDAAYPRYAMDLATWPEGLGHAHNYYINVAAETGVLGLLAFAAVTAAVFWIGWRATHPTPARAGSSDATHASSKVAPAVKAIPVHALALGCFAVIAALWAHNLTDDLFVHGMDLQVALTLACLTYFARHRDIG